MTIFGETVLLRTYDACIEDMRHQGGRNPHLWVDVFVDHSEHGCLATNRKLHLIRALVHLIHRYVPVAYTCHLNGLHSFGADIPRMMTGVPSPRVCRISALFQDDSFHTVGFLLMTD